MCVDLNIIQILEFQKCAKFIRGGLKKMRTLLKPRGSLGVVECVCRFEINLNS